MVSDDSGKKEKTLEFEGEKRPRIKSKPHKCKMALNGLKPTFFRIIGVMDTTLNGLLGPKYAVANPLP
jgi:hypothetical protein